MFGMRIGYRAGAHALEAVRTTIGHSSTGHSAEQRHSTRSDVTDSDRGSARNLTRLQGLHDTQQ
jgi:hypothetical protein